MKNFKTFYLQFLFAILFCFAAIGLSTQKAVAQPGKMDLTFNHMYDFLEYSGSSAIVRAVLVQPDGKIIVGGNFFKIKDQNTNAETEVRGLVRFNPDGTVDNSFNAGVSFVDGVNGVYCLEFASNGDILVGGRFIIFYDKNGAHTCSAYARISATDGTLIHHGIVSGGESVVKDILPTADGGFYIGGNFTHVDGRPEYANLAKIQANSLLDLSFRVVNNLASPTGWAPITFPGSVNALALRSDGKLVVGGTFTLTYWNDWNNPQDCPGLVIIDPGTNRVNRDVNSWSIRANVTDLLALPAPSVSTLIIGQDRFNTSGYFVGSLPMMGAYTSYDGLPRQIIKQPDGKFIVVGDFTQEKFSGQTHNGIIRLNANCSVDNTFAPGNGNGFSDACYDLALSPDNKKVYVGGQFNLNEWQNRRKFSRLHLEPELYTGNPGLSASICVETGGFSFNMPYSSLGRFPTNYPVAVQLSNASGSFTSPTTIGSGTISGSDPSGTIACNIPTSITNGSNYYIRVIGTSGLDGLTYNSPIGPFELFVGSGDINITENATTVSNGATINFGTFNQYTVISKTFTIENISASANLDLTGSPIVSYSGDPGFTITAQPTSSTIAPAGSLTFEVTYAGDPGTKSTGMLTIENSCCNQPTYTINLIAECFSLTSEHAITFDGTDDLVDLGNPAALQITGDQTIEMWLKPSNFSARRNPFAKAYGGEGTITQETNGQLSYYYGTSGINGGTYQGINSVTPLTVNKWHHIAIVRDLSAMTLTWYIDGVETNSTTANYASATAGSLNAFIGKGYVSNYDGEIDEVRIWNTARSQQQIQNYMYSELTGNETGLVAYYPFDDATTAANGIRDHSGNANHGTMTNMDAYDIVPSSVKADADRSHNILEASSIVLKQNAESYRYHFTISVEQDNESTYIVQNNTGTNSSIAVQWRADLSGTINAAMFSNNDNAQDGTWQAMIHNTDYRIGGYDIYGNATYDLSIAIGAGRFVEFTPQQNQAGDAQIAIVIQNSAGESAKLLINLKTIADPDTNQPEITEHALSFDGTDDFVDLGNPAALQITGDQTIEMWLKPSNFSARRNPFAKAYGGEGTITQETDGQLSYYYGISGINGGTYQGFYTGTSLTVNEWHHIAIVRDLSAMTLTWYIDGEETNSTTANYASAAVSGLSALIGKGYVSNYDGEIDEVRFWNRALTQSEIVENMHKEMDGSEDGLVAYYTFDEGAGTLAYDKSGNNSHGTLTNGPTWIDAPIEDMTGTPQSGAKLIAYYDFENGLTGAGTDVMGNWDIANSHGNAQLTNTNTVFNNALLLDGNGDYLETVNIPTVSYSDITLSLWFWLDPGTNESGYCSQFVCLNAGDIEMQLGPNLDPLISSHAGFGGSWTEINADNLIKEQEWHQFVFTTSLTERAVYIDGIKVYKEALSGYSTATYNNSIFNFGSQPTNPGEDFFGMLDEIRIYDGYLTEVEVESLYKYGHANFLQPEIPTICDVEIQKGESTDKLHFTVNDAEISGGSVQLSLTCVSTNNDDLLNASAGQTIDERYYIFGGQGANRWVQIHPSYMQSGTATLRITASDLDNTATRDFTLTVSDENVQTVANSRTAYHVKGDDLAGAGGTAVNTWTDVSGGNNDALQANGQGDPSISNTQINNQNVVNFDGDDVLRSGVSSLLANPEASMFIVFKDLTPTGDDDIVYSSAISGTMNEEFCFVSYGTAFSNYGGSFYHHSSAGNFNHLNHQTTINGSPHLATGVLGEDVNSIFYEQDGVASTNLVTNPMGTASNYTYIPRRVSLAARNDNNCFIDADIAEVLVYNYKVSEAERIITNNYLAAKWAIPMLANDYFAYDSETGSDGIAGTYDHDVTGIGADGDGYMVTQATSDILRVSNARDLEAGEYLLFGHQDLDGASGNRNMLSWTATNAPADKQITDRQWRFDQTGGDGVGNITVTFEMILPYACLKEVTLLVDTDGDADFSNATEYALSHQEGKATAEIPVTDGMVLALTISDDIIWTGNTDIDWDDPTNWCPSIDIPTQTDNVTIPTTPVGSNFPLDNTGADGETKNLTLEPGSQLTVPSGKVLHVYGDLLLETPNDNTPSGSLIDYGTLTVDGTVTIERYFTVNGRWQYVSTPLNNSTSDLFTRNTASGNYNPNLYSYNEAYNCVPDPANTDYDNWKTTDLVYAWQYAHNGAGGADVALTPTTGYITYNEGNIQVDFTGNTQAVLNTGDQNYTLSYHLNDDNSGANGDYYDGWNLVGNPFPSALDWDDADWDKTNIHNTVYYYDGSAGNYKYYNGQTGTNGTQANDGSDAVNGGSQHIPAMQAFFVHARNTGDGQTFVLEQDCRSHSAQTMWKSDSTAQTEFVKFKIEYNGLSDEMVVRLKELATDEFDPDFDAYKMYSWNIETPQIYSYFGETNTPYSINSISYDLDNEKTVPLSYIVPEAGEYSVTMSDFHSENIRFYLKDNLSDTLVRINESFVYTFTAPAEGEPEKERFELIIRANAAPYVNAQPANHEVECSEVFYTKLPYNTFGDADEDDILTYQAVLLPDWLEFNPVSLELYGVSPHENRTEQVKISATDLMGASCEAMFEITTKCENSNNVTENDNQISVYPNPTNGIVNISGFQSTDAMPCVSNVKITDITGKQIQNIQYSKQNNQYSVDLSELENGIYLIKIETETDVYTHKIVKF